MSELSERGAPGKAKKMIKVFEGTPAGGDKITLDSQKTKPGQRPGEAKKLIQVYEEKKVALDLKPEERKKRVLIVYAHPEEKSFNGAMFRTAKKTFSDMGYEMSVSDLYAMKFNPVAGKGDIGARSESKPSQPSSKLPAKEQQKETPKVEKPKADEKPKEKPAEAAKKDEEKPAADKPADSPKDKDAKKDDDTKPASDQKPPEKADDKKPEAKADDKKPEAKPAEKKDDKKPDPKADEKKAEVKPAEKKPDAKPAEKKPDAKPAEAKPSKPKESDHFRYMEEMQLAYEEGRLAQDIVKEQQKVSYADLIIFQFPLHWGSYPAILKGWMDRVLSQGFAFGPHCYDKGNMKGKVVLSFSTRDPQTTYTPTGAHGDIDVFLWPMQYAILRYCGFDILAPQICYSPSSANAESYLKAWATRLKTLINERAIRFIPIENYDEAKGFQLEDKMLKLEASKSTTGLTTGQHLGKPLPPNFMITEPAMTKK